MEEKWKSVEYKIQEFLYGERGLETTAYSNPSLDKYYWDMDEIISILKELKEMYANLNDKQKEKLNRYKEYFLEIDNGKNGVKEMYKKILDIYDNIDEY